jgi:hypothetical protein
VSFILTVTTKVTIFSHKVSRSLTSSASFDWEARAFFPGFSLEAQSASPENNPLFFPILQGAEDTAVMAVSRMADSSLKRFWDAAA